MKRQPIQSQRFPEDSLTIDAVSTNQLTKSQLVEAINMTFPDEKISQTSKIATVVTTKMRTGEKRQTLILGLELELQGGNYE